MFTNENISVVLSGVCYKEFDLLFTVKKIKDYFPSAEIILSTNDKEFINRYKDSDLIDILIFNNASGELPSLKFPLKVDLPIINNNINLQIAANYKGISAATNDLVLKLRTDQILMDDSVLRIWSELKGIKTETGKKGLIITSSIFSINPRYSERMPYHISDMRSFSCNLLN